MTLEYLFERLEIRKQLTKYEYLILLYYLEHLILYLLGFLSIAVTGLFTGNLRSTIAFSLVMVSLRSRTGGFHTDRPSVCIACSVILVLLIPFEEYLLIRTIGNNEFLIISIYICAYVIAFLFTPVNTPNIHLSDKEVYAYKRLAKRQIIGWYFADSLIRFTEAGKLAVDIRLGVIIAMTTVLIGLYDEKVKQRKMMNHSN